MKRAHNDVSKSSCPEPVPSSLPAQCDGPVDLTRPPKISRKVQACSECQRRKIKCDVAPNRPVCSRCHRKDLRCIVNKSLQTLLEDESGWKTSMEQTSQQLQSAVSEILRTLNLPSLDSFRVKPLNDGNAVSNALPQRSTDVSQQNQIGGMTMTRENSQEHEGGNEINDTLISAPMGSLYEVTKLRNLRSNPQRPAGSGTSLLAEDFISKGKISEAEAQELFEAFSKSLNHFLWGGIALVHTDLASVRKSSSLLAAAILTVTALHIPGKTRTFDICYAEFLALICDSMLDRYHTLDGVRGFCIGAFWLSDVSWKLSGHAVRIATELNLHQSYARAMKGSIEHLEGARLWYFLYVCDHHFSIAYGRPPVIHYDVAIAGRQRFLQLPGVTQADLRLHSQVAIFVILTEIYDKFGPDIEQMLTDDDLDQVRHFNVSIDGWRSRWEGLLAPNPYIGTYPSKGVELHFHFAKLQLNSLSLRGCQLFSPEVLSPERKGLASIAISSAMAVMRMVLYESDVRSAIVGVPLYLHTMISYSAVFLLKVHQKWKAFQLGTDSASICELVGKTIKLLSQARAGERHLVYQISNGLRKMLDRFIEWEIQDSQALATTMGSQDEAQHTHMNPGYQAANSMYEPNRDYVPAGFYAQPLELYDFPAGFFDVFSSYLPA